VVSSTIRAKPDMTRPLDGIREKIARAREDFQTIEGEVRAWFAGKLYPVIHYHDSLTGWHSVKPEPITEPIPLRWPVVLGELIHDLRSALDHLITLLVIANGQTANRGNQFPIYSYGRDATWTKSDWSQRRSHFRRCVSGLSSDDVAVIKSVQPYRRRRQARLPYIALETIAEFSNLDKHQTLPAVFTVTVPWQTYRVNVTAPPGTREVARRVPTGGTVTPIGETELFAVQIDPPATIVQFQMLDPIQVAIGFGEAGRIPLGDILNLIAEVERTVSIFQKRIEPLS
jgi:hypothetical protein